MALSPYLLIAALFLPLFPLSMIFNEVYARLNNAVLRAVLLAVWPLVGVWALTQLQQPPPFWLVGWAMASAVLSAYRMLALRDAGTWTSFLATSAWPILWAVSFGHASPYYLALGLSLPLVLLCLVTGIVEHKYGAAHTAMKIRLASTSPRLAALFVAGVLAAVATPVFPNFFVLLTTIVGQVPATPAYAAAVLLVWLLWSWSGARLLQGIAVGDPERSPVNDMSVILAALFTLGFAGLAVSGVILGDMLL